MAIEFSLQPSGKMRKQRTRTYTNTILGILGKRIELVREGNMEDDIAVLDRALRIIGYEGEIDDLMPVERPQHLFGTGELRLALLDTLRQANRPLKSRELVTITLQNRVCGPIHPDHVASATLNVSKALKGDKNFGNVRTEKPNGWALVWTMT